MINKITSVWQAFHMMFHVIARNFYLLLFVLPFSLFAENESDPVKMLQTATQSVMSEVQNRKVELESNLTLSYGIVERYILPLVDIVTMTRIVLGRQHWNDATPDQRRQFSDAFTTLLIRTYATTLVTHNDEKIAYLPLRGDWQSQSRIQVTSVITPKSDQPFQIVYRLIKRDNDWKVYDFTLDGVSLLQSFNEQFDSEIKTSSLAATIQNLEKRNAELLNQAKSGEA